MNQPIDFSKILDAVEQLDAEAQAEFVAILHRRLAERAREHIASSVAGARREFAAGHCRVMSAAELVREASS